MDANRFDRLTTLLTTSLSRRHGLGALAALGLGASALPSTPAARKKRKPHTIRLCLNGQTIKVKKRKLRKKYPGATIGACPPCRPTTCAAQGRACGPLADGCGLTVSCGVCGAGATPSCRDTGGCALCSVVCPPACAFCANRSDGGTTCVTAVMPTCTSPCATDADCPAASPNCVSTFTDRNSGITTDLPTTCGKTTPGICAWYRNTIIRITPCGVIGLRCRPAIPWFLGSVQLFMALAW